MADKKSKQQTAVTHWADQIAQNIIREKGDKDSYTLAAGITPSGVVHLGNFREVITIELIVRALKDLGKKVRFIYVWDDYDVFRKVPVNMPKQDLLKTFLRQPIVDVPDTFGCHGSYAEHNEKMMEKDMPSMGIHPEYIYQTQRYRKCHYAEDIKIAMQKDNIEKIKEIINKVRKEPLADDWYPTSIFCDKCKNDKTKILDYNQEYNVKYSCECGHEETFDIRKKGIIKLKWRIDWPMRWAKEKVDFESGGKDHFAAGGSFYTGLEICKHVFGYGGPSSSRYEFINIKGGAEFSSSKGVATTVGDAMEVYEPEMIRWLFAGSRPTASFSVAFDDEIIKIYEDFDKVERIYYGEEKVNEKETAKQKRIYELSMIDKPQPKLPYQPSFRHLTNVVQMHDMDVDQAIAYYEKDLKNKFDKDRLRLRATCAKNWLEKYAPEQFKFTIQDEIPADADLDDNMKSLFQKVADRLQEKTWDDKELHDEFYILCKSLDIQPKDFFQAAYKVLINKERGPKLAGFILMLGKRALTILEKAAQ